MRRRDTPSDNPIRAASRSGGHVRWIGLTGLALALALGLGSCDAPDPVASSGGQTIDEVPKAAAPEPPRAVLLRVGHRAVQRVELDPSDDGPPQSSAEPPVVLGRPIVAAAAAGNGVLAASLERTDGRFVLERRTLEGTGARTVTPLDRVHGDGPTAVLAQDGGGVVLGTASEIRYVEPGEGGVALGVHRLPQPRPVFVLAEIGDELWAFDDSASPGLVHRFAAGERALPRFLATTRLPTRETRQVLELEGSRVLLLSGAGTQRELIEVDIECLSNGAADCVVQRAMLPAAAVGETVDRMALAPDGLWLAAGDAGLLRMAWPPTAAGDDDEDASAAVGSDALARHDLGRPVHDVASWGDATLVVLGSPDAVAWLTDGSPPGLTGEAPLGGPGTLLRPGSLR